MAGVALGLFLLLSAYNGNIYTIRIIIFVGMLAAAQFAEIYAHALNAQGLSLGRTVAPNMSIVVGVLLCLALTFDPKNPKKGLQRLRRMQAGQPSDSVPDAAEPDARPQPGSWADEYPNWGTGSLASVCSPVVSLRMAAPNSAAPLHSAAPFPGVSVDAGNAVFRVLGHRHRGAGLAVVGR